MATNPKHERILQAFSDYGFSLTRDQGTKFCRFYDLLMKYNESHDLTRIRKFEDIILKHFIDSVYITKLLDLTGPVVDIGTGAGFPGIPLKIIDPSINVILAEPKHKRVSFMEIAIKELGLSGVEVYPHLVTEKSFFAVNSVITRALESVQNTLSRVSHFLPKDGLVYFLKGPDVDSEEQLDNSMTDSYILEQDIPYTLPGSKYKRRLVVYRKITETIQKTYKIMTKTDETVGLPITSTDNKRFKEVKKLTTGDGIKKAGKTVISGKRVIKEFLNDTSLIIDEMIIYDGYTESDESLIARINDLGKNGKLLILKKSLYNEIDIFKTNSPLITISLPEMIEWDKKSVSGCTLAIPFQDPANVGAVIRTAAGFGISRILLLKEGANPFHPKSIRASAGAVFKVEIVKGPSVYELQNCVSANNIEILSLDASGKPVEEYSFPDNFILLPGIEGPGLPDELRTNTISIPLSGGIESLNGPVAVSIALYEWQRG